MSKGQKFLKVTSILMIVGGALSGVTCLLCIAGVAPCNGARVAGKGIKTKIS